MSEPTHQVTVRLSPDTFEALTELAQRAERSIAAEVRVAIKQHVAPGKRAG